MLVINAHAHGWDRTALRQGRLALAWDDRHVAQDYVATCHSRGLRQVVVLDPPELVFREKELFGDFVVPVPMIHPGRTTVAEVEDYFARGAAGIKFIAPEVSYGDESLFPLYETIARHNGLAVFHTGFVATGLFGAADVMPRRKVIDITDMRPAALDRVARAFPELKILMAHFGNPWWEEAWKICSSHKNIYADLCGGTAHRRDLRLWEQIFAPNGNLDTTAVNKLCFATDGSYLPELLDYDLHLRFYQRLLKHLRVPEPLCQKVWSGNIAALLDLPDA